MWYLMGTPPGFLLYVFALLVAQLFFLSPHPDETPLQDIASLPVRVALVEQATPSAERAPSADAAGPSWAEVVLKEGTRRLLGFDPHHVQGLAVTDSSIFVTAVQLWPLRGWLFELDRLTHALLRKKELTEGTYVHPGGLSFDGRRLWIPLAQYRPGGATRILAVSAATLAIVQRLHVDDHVSLLAADGRGRLYGTDWDSQFFYAWDAEGHRLLQRFRTPTGVAYQDCEHRDGQLICGGYRDGAGTIDVIDPHRQAVVRRLRVGKTERGRPLTREGLSVHGRTVYLLPEGGDASTMRTFALAGLP